MLALRTADGLDLNYLEENYGPIAVEKILIAVKPYIENGLVIKDDREMSIAPHTFSSVVRLSDPDGFLLSNDIISSVFVELTC
jgi:coproporphyrinogen III oxidase-like Fe-S oxidoreductase